MSQAKHTHGPWSVARPRMGFSEIVGAADEKQPDDVCDANARLIAVAPDLLAAAKAFVEQYDGFSDGELERRRIALIGEGSYADVPHVLSFRAAIRKADGASS